MFHVVLFFALVGLSCDPAESNKEIADEVKPKTEIVKPKEAPKPDPEPEPEPEPEEPEPEVEESKKNDWAFTPETKFFLEFGACAPRACPQFTVEVDAEGNVTFMGVDNVAKFGAQKRAVSPKKVAGFIDRLTEIDFASMDPEWIAETCKKTAGFKSGAKVELSLVDGGQVHRILDDYGCPGREKLRAFQKELRDALVPKAWLKPPRVFNDYQKSARKKLSALKIRNVVGHAPSEVDEDDNSLELIYGDRDLILYAWVPSYAGRFACASEKNRFIGRNGEATKVSGLAAWRSTAGDKIAIEASPITCVQIELAATDTEKLMKAAKTFPLSKLRMK